MTIPWQGKGEMETHWLIGERNSNEEVIKYTGNALKDMKLVFSSIGVGHTSADPRQSFMICTIVGGKDWIVRIVDDQVKHGR